ncbi:hypothetical protein [Nonlabens ulvanivorans]|uniref:Uncharacterized protein n=1 Tax=Nonlabens ulvanivorans TaxID=906888 RepID=A0A081D7F0_NONUL|nr:hypothetical protein [Nonlabens ulvanivorans]GAK74846.1 hypothetical protein JCM19296_424 [Nonlabens ulvanivorans]GAK98720.1 hypothetical protein JCM19314_2751 [Nonlabens ulvanivorans]
MSRDEQLKERWAQTVAFFQERFSDGEQMDIDAILFIIGVQELGQLHRKFQKDEKYQLMHIAICRVLEPYGYYEFSHFDDDKWPHYIVKENLPPLKAGEQSLLMKEAIVQYMIDAEVIN